MLLLALCATTLAMSQAAVGAQTSGAEIVRGRVTNDSGAALAGAEVIATRAPDRLFLRTQTDSAGYYEIRFADGTGDYLVHVSAQGRRAFRKRITRTSDDTVLVLDVSLAREQVELAPVIIRGTRSRPSRGPDFGVETGAAEKPIDGVPAALAPEDEGDLRAMALTVPGVVATPGGFSVLGLAANQNNATLNGLSFSGGDLPRDARVEARVSSSTYDPSRGGFGGAQVALELAPGGFYTSRRAHATMDTPGLQYSDPTSERSGREFQSAQLSAGGDGELISNALYYNGAIQVTRRSSDVVTATVRDDDLYLTAHVAPDSVQKFLRTLADLQIPIGTPLSAQVNETASFITRFDRTPYGDQAAGLVAFGKIARINAVGASITTTPSLSAQRSSAVGGLQAMVAHYTKAKLLNETRAALTLTRDWATPDYQLPAGEVFVASRSATGADDLSALTFGGNAQLQYTSNAWTVEATNETQWYTATSAHRLKLFGQTRLDGYSRSSAANVRGTFTYGTLADLAANRPSAFTRTLGSTSVDGGAWSGAAALGDLWRMSPELHVLYGARLETNYYPQTPPLDAAALQTFGVRSDIAPNTVHLSPRLGFTWIYMGAKNNRPTRSVGNFGTRIAGPAGVLRGGIGEFRNLLSPTLLVGAQSRAQSRERVSCVGSAVPTPLWSEYESEPNAIPAQCAEGAEASFVDSARSVEVFDRRFTAARSWRMNLAWNSQWRRLGFAMEALYSLNLNQPGSVDLNFSDSPKFVLASENNRPVYVGPSGIIETSGVVSPVGARRSGSFGRVVSNHSDLRSSSRQLTVSLMPTLPTNRAMIGVSYTLGDVRAEARGFDAATFWSPALRELAPGDFDVRHQFLLQAGWGRENFAITLFARVTSGLPFTPLVGSDINGDGLSNDRAFIFAPAQGVDSALARGLASVLSSSPARVRDCLMEQLGRPASRNSCRGPWSQSINARIRLGSPFAQARRFSDRVRLSINITNIGAGADQLLHGSNRLRGWGTQGFPDQTLYRVVGFVGTPANAQFHYAVNSHFGQTRAGPSIISSPFRMTLDASVNWSRSPDVQQIERAMRPSPISHRRVQADSLAIRYARTVTDVYQRTLIESDSLLLTRAQFEALSAAHSRYRNRVDSIWVDLASYLISLPDAYDMGDALKHQEEATSQVWEITRREGDTFREVLSPLQLRMLPDAVRSIVESKERIRSRRYM